MLSKTNRLAKTRDVSMVHSRGRSFFSPFFIVKFLARTDGGKRFTVVVSTKVSKKAVVRNRVKRIIREYIRLNLAQFKPGDYMIQVRSSASTKTASELRNTLETTCIKVKLI